MDNLGSVTVPNRFLLKAERRQNDTAVKGAFGAFSYRRLSEQAAAWQFVFPERVCALALQLFLLVKVK